MFVKDFCLDYFWIMPKTPKYVDSAKIPYITSKNLKNGKIDYSNCKYITEEAFKNLTSKRYIQEEDFLISMIGTVGEVGIVNKDDLPIYGQNMYLLRPNYKMVDKRYLYNFLTSTTVKTKLLSILNGATQGYLRDKDITELNIINRSLPEQRYIAKQLDNIRNSISIKKLVLFSLDELVKSRFIEMFGEPLSESYTTPLSQACIFNPKKSEKKDWTDETIISFIPMPLVSEHGEINTGTLKTYKEVKTGFTYFRENDVLFAKITPCMENGKGAIAQNLKNGIGFGSTEFHVLRPIEGVSNPYWIYYLTAIDSFRIMAEKKMTGSAGQKRVPISFFENMKVNLPPIELQNEFAEFVKLIDKSKFVCHSKNFLCDIFTFSSSTIAYPSVVSIFVCPKRC